MPLPEIDDAATRTRLDTITANGLRALGECARRSAEIDEQVQAMLERREREKQALDELVARARDKQARDKRADPEQPARRTTLAMGPPARRTLVLGAPEDREVEAEPAPTPPPRPPAERRAPVDRDEDLSGHTWLR